MTASELFDKYSVPYDVKQLIEPMELMNKKRFIEAVAEIISFPLELPVKPAKANKETEELKRALRVIYTWATFEGGTALVPDHVKKLIEKLDIKS